MTTSSDAAYSAWLLAHPNANICTHHREAFAQGYEANADALTTAVARAERAEGEVAQLQSALDAVVTLDKGTELERQKEHNARLAAEGEVAAMRAAMDEEWVEIAFTGMATMNRCPECGWRQHGKHGSSCTRGRFFALASASASTPTLVQVAKDAQRYMDSLPEVHSGEVSDYCMACGADAIWIAPSDNVLKGNWRITHTTDCPREALRASLASLSPAAIVQGMGGGDDTRRVAQALQELRSQVPHETAPIQRWK